MFSTIKFLCIVLCIFFWNFQISFSAINYSVTPIKYELDLNPGESITVPASIRNNGDSTVTLPTSSSDFQTNGTSGVPSLVRKSELVFPDQQLSTWITIEDSSVTLNPGQEVTTNFTIDVPVTATPGGHYGAVLFQNTGSESSSDGNIDINVDYGIIILVNVSGEVETGAEIEDPIITGGGIGGGSTSSNSTITNPNTDESEENVNSIVGNNEVPETEGEENQVSENEGKDNETQNTDEGWYVGEDENGSPIYIYPDICPLGDFTTSKYDNKCFGIPDSDSSSNDNIETNNGDPVLFEDDFEVNFEFPIRNTGNTHIKPSGKIILKDENGIIKAIGKETISNDRGIVIGEEIVDYIPINNQGGNVLPSSKRVFESKWEGFPYKTFDDQGNPVVNYWTPSEYYTQKNKEDAGFLMFWERVSENRTYKEVTADIELIYYDEEGNPIEFNTSRTFPIQYIEEVVTINPYVILGLLLVATAIILTLGAIRWWIILFKENKCWSCEEKIKSHWKTCPHCKSLQDKQKDKAFKKQAENIDNKDLPKKSTPKKSAPKKSAPKKSAPKKSAPKKSAPKKSAPKKSAPKKK